MEPNNKTKVSELSKKGRLARSVQLCVGLFRSPSDVGICFVENGRNMVAILFILLKGILLSGILFGLSRVRLETYIDTNEFGINKTYQEFTISYLMEMLPLLSIVFVCVILYSFFSALLYWLTFKILAKSSISYGKIQRAIGGKNYYLIPPLIISILLYLISQILNVDLSPIPINKVLFIIALIFLIASIAFGNMSFTVWLKKTTRISNNKFVCASIIVKTILGIVLSIFLYFLISCKYIDVLWDMYLFLRFL